LTVGGVSALFRPLQHSGCLNRQCRLPDLNVRLPLCGDSRHLIWVTRVAASAYMVGATGRVNEGAVGASG
jgi:hypothetical protein